MKLDLKSGLFIFFAIATIALGGLYLYNPAIFKPRNVSPLEEVNSQSIGVNCGGWDTFGDVVCDCSGSIEEFTCGPNAFCDSGTDTCYGTCGECKCYTGPASDGVEIPCNGRDRYFK